MDHRFTFQNLDLDQDSTRGFMLQDTMIDIAQQIQHFSLTIHPQQLKWLRNAIPAKQLSPIAPFFFFFSSVSDTWCQSAGTVGNSATSSNWRPATYTSQQLAKVDARYLLATDTRLFILT